MKKSLLILGLLICTLANYAQQAGTFKDPRDGKVYKTVKIGTQTWFAENLAYKPGTGNYWAYDNNQSNAAKYGYLYDWKTAKTVCPTGWHLPSDEEWTTLINYLGGDEVSGGKIKATTDWESRNSDATNSSGFNALPAGNRDNEDGSFHSLGIGTHFWSITQDEDEDPWYRSIDYSYFPGVNRDPGDQASGYSIRCIKN